MDESDGAFGGFDEELHDQPEIRIKNPAAVQLGRLGGLKGGKARAKALSPERRKEIARKAALKRWSKAVAGKEEESK